MKPITLSPDQLDAALAVAPVRHLSPLQVDHLRNVRTVDDVTDRRNRNTLGAGPKAGDGEVSRNIRALLVAAGVKGKPRRRRAR